MTEAPARVSASGRFAVLLTASLVSSLIMLDSNVVAVALPAIGRSFKASFSDIQWVISAYVLTYAALLLGSGAYADLRGRRRAMIIGLIIFAAASAACGLAPSALILNLSRAAQGVGGAFLLTASLAIISHDFPGPERVGATAFWGAALGIALALGPIVGGVITNLAGWRWVFLVNLPLSAGLIVAALRWIEESKDPQAKRLDVAGVLTFSVGLSVTIWALNAGNDAGWTSTPILLRLAAGAVLFAGFTLIELRQPRPMVDFTLFRRRTFLGASVAMIAYGAGAQVMVFFLPLQLQNAYQLRPITAGVAMLPFALPMVLAPRVTTALAQRFSGRVLLTAGLLTTAIGDLLFWTVARAQLSYTTFALTMLVAGCGAGILNGQTVKVLVAAAPADRSGMASGLASTTRFIGILVSVAAMGAVLSRVISRVFQLAATAAGLSPDAATAAARRVTAGDLPALLQSVPSAARATIQAAAVDSFGDGFAAASLLAAAVAVTGAVLAFLLIDQAETAHVGTPVRRPCKLVDCRDPL